jgi:peptide/nickel transport system permease protein
VTRKILATVAIVFIGAVFTVAIAPQVFAPHSPTEVDLAHEYGPFSPEHPLGQGVNGVDILSQLIFGARTSLSVALPVVMMTLTLGLCLGSAAGYRGGRIDLFISAICDVVFAFPGMLLAIALAAVVGPGRGNVILLLAATGWPAITRLVRSEVLRLKHQEFILAAVSQGASGVHIFIRHLIPNLVPILTVQASFSMAGVILVESSLSFLGLGVPPGTPTWGGLLAMGKDALLTAWHVSAVPGLTLMTLVLSFNMVGDWLRDRLDPWQRQLLR